MKYRTLEETPCIQSAEELQVELRRELGKL